MGYDYKFRSRGLQANFLASSVYENISDKYTLEYPSTILACLAFVVTIPIYIFYWKGPVLRERSKFAQTLASDRKARRGRRVLTEREKAEGTRLEEGPPGNAAGQ